MRLSKLTWSGIVCLGLGIGVFFGWDAWIQTRTNRPVYVPVALRPGHVRTPEFRVNMNATYTLGIEAKKAIPFQTLSCLLGVEWPASKCDRPSVVKGNWVLTSGDEVIARADNDIWNGGEFSNDTIVREIGSFHLEKGRSYVLNADFGGDLSALAATDPHLKIEVGGGRYEDDAVAGFLLFWPCLALAVFGLTVLLFKVARRLRPKSYLRLDR